MSKSYTKIKDKLSLNLSPINDLSKILPNVSEDTNRWFEEMSLKKSQNFRNKIKRYIKPIKGIEQ